MRKIRPFMDKNIIKVLTGIRRSGKSVMLQLIQEELKNSGVKENEILTFNFEDMAYVDLTDAQKLNDLVMASILENPTIRYLFFDEIQEVQDWERCVNSLLSKGQFDIYITGSNARLLSGELATYLAGRYIEIHVFPFSFAEFIELYKHEVETKSIDSYFTMFLQFGGFPFIRHFFAEPAAISDYLKDIYNFLQYGQLIFYNIYALLQINGDINITQRLIFSLCKTAEKVGKNDVGIRIQIRRYLRY